MLKQPSASEPVLKFGCLVVSDQVASTLPLEMTTVNLHVSGPLASAAVTQRFGNPLEQVAHLDYLYPLPEGAAITDFTLTIGERTIRGELKETAEAAAAFEQARQAGQRAGLFEQRRENLFAVRLANVRPGETISATVRYQQRVTFNEDGYELVFPMGLTPKYDRPGHPEESAGVHAPIARSGEPIGPVEIFVALDAGSACADPLSPSHDLQTVRLDEHRFQVRLAGQYIPDHDFVLCYSPQADRPVAAAWLVDAAGGGYFLANLLPPRSIDEAKPAPREFIFVLDRSGSMGGEPILQARNALRACLRALNPGDAFRILLFDDRLEWYRQEASPVNQAEIDTADRFLAGVDARGGTEIMASLEASLGLPTDSGRTRYVVFLTDGAVSAELSALDLLRKKVGSARVFTFGIGPSGNRALLNRMAAVGRGAAEFLQADEDIEGAILRFQDRVSFPVLTGLKLNLSGASAWDIYPAQLPDLYTGQPLVVCGRIQHKPGEPLSLTLTGTRGAETVTLATSFTPTGPDEPAVARAWARARIDDLLGEAELSPQREEKIRAAVLELALAHRLVSPYTSFVGVDQTASVGEGQAVTIQVAQPLPQGLDWGRPQLTLN
ncbi:MAG TPA: VIT domain-containing protein, partial [Anaerolinea sp.]|nr:VIT domain-containing protein [Anaerolinea sp.]